MDKFEPWRKRLHCLCQGFDKNSLIDYFRKQPGRRPLPLKTVGINGKAVSRGKTVSLDYYARELEIKGRAFELQLFKEALFTFGLAKPHGHERAPEINGPEDLQQRGSCKKDL